jgi:hypothetical protein
MPFHMKLEIVRVECVVEQLNEVGKDEMRAIGWGVSRKGHFFSLGFRDLGSFGEGDVKPPGALPQTLFERDLEDDGLEVAFFLWLVEEDGGGVRNSAASLDQQFRTLFLEISQSMTGSGFPRDCIPLLALFRTAQPFTRNIAEAGTQGRNDTVFSPIQAFMRPDLTAGFLPPPVITERVTFLKTKKVGTFFVDFRATYRRIEESFQ